MRSPNALLLMSVLAAAALLSACKTIPPAMSEGPQGKGWLVYNQGYSKREVSQSTSQNYSNNTQTTTTQWSSVIKTNIGSFLTSAEKPSCAPAATNIKACAAFGNTKGGGDAR